MAAALASTYGEHSTQRRCEVPESIFLIVCAAQLTIEISVNLCVMMRMLTGKLHLI